MGKRQGGAGVKREEEKEWMRWEVEGGEEGKDERKDGRNRGKEEGGRCR